MSNPVTTEEIKNWLDNINKQAEVFLKDESKPLEFRKEMLQLQIPALRASVFLSLQEMKRISS